MTSRRSIFFLVFFSLLFFFHACLVFRTGIVGVIDRHIHDFFSRLTGPGWLRIGHAVTFFGNGFFLYVLAAVVILLLLLQRRFRPALRYFLLLAAGFGTNALLKICFARPRPVGYDPSYVLKSYAYPSGHAFDSFIFYFLTLLMLSDRFSPCARRLAFLLFAVLIAAIGFSRLILGVHWASDVTGGFLLGAAWIFLNPVLANPLKGRSP